MIREYRKIFLKNIFIILFFLIVGILFSFFYLYVGTDSQIVIFEIRLPQLFGALFTGALLSIAGLLMQKVLKNSLASPFTLGVSHGALFGVSLSIVFFNGEFLESFAFVFAFAVILFILFLSSNHSSEVIVLVGVAISALFGAFSMLIQYFADDIELSNIINWSFGDLSKADFNNLIIEAIVLFLSLIYLYLNRWNYNALEIQESENIGVNKKKLIVVSLVIATLLTSISVAYFGIIGFIGLVAPHISRLLVGGDFRFLLFLSSIIGALLLLVADFFSKIVLSPVVIPVGILTSTFGALFFLFLLLKVRR